MFRIHKSSLMDALLLLQGTLPYKYHMQKAFELHQPICSSHFPMVYNCCKKDRERESP